MRTKHSRIGAFALGLLASLAVAAPASASVTPVVDCVEPNTATGTRWVYFGYVNTGPPLTIDFGTQNQILPGFGFQGQPTVFNVGSYPRVVRAVWNQAVFSAVAWDLNGLQAIGDASTPFCASGATGPASDLTTVAATLHGLVDSRNVETTYSFEYGETIAYEESTPERTLTSPTPQLVEEPIAGLEPDTTYHYRLISDGTVPTVGEDRTFTTGTLPPPPPTPPDPPAAEPPRFNLSAAVKRCKRKFEQGSRGRKRCVARAKRLATWA